MLPTDLPAGSAPQPVDFPHFPDRLHAFVWRNWPLVPLERMAQTIGATPEEIQAMGQAMGLSGPPPIPPDQPRRSYITLIRRNWHLLPYEQLLTLLDWTPEQMAFTLREDDFLFTKLGLSKPQCAPIRYRPPDEAVRGREREIAALVREQFPKGIGETPEPLFAFIDRLSTLPDPPNTERPTPNTDPRFCYSYFALYGDPLLETETDSYPDGYLARLAASGVNGVWLQAVLYRLAPFPWQPEISARHRERRDNLRALVERAGKHGLGVYLYLNEPRAMPLAFYEAHPAQKGVVEIDHAALCTSDPAVQQYLTDSVASLCRDVPDLAGIFTITASENLTNCWSHHRGEECPRCGLRAPAEVIAEVNGLIYAGIRQAGSQTPFIAWDWGWRDEWAEEIIRRLPAEAALMSVSEWSLPIRRGGVESVVGEYSISAVGPGPRALRHWEIARQRGLRAFAKIQANNTWELSAVPYIPAVENVARHAANLREIGVDGLMLGWTLGGYPSPNLEVVAEMGEAHGRNGEPTPTPEEAMERIARRRFGEEAAPAVVGAWRAMSAAFAEFPYHGSVVYSAPQQYGPANLLWEQPTGYKATMVGFPYDDLDSWRAVYPPEVFIEQLEKVADGFEQAIGGVQADPQPLNTRIPEHLALREELRIMEASALHFRSVANQARFVLARNALAAAQTADAARPLLLELERVLNAEIALARRLYAIQSRDSRIGFEATNHYYYVPLDLVEKVLNSRDLLDRWLPAQRARWNL